MFFYMDEGMPTQKGKVFVLREHQAEAIKNLSEMRQDNHSIALVQGETRSGKTAIGVLDAKQVGERTLFLAHTKELVEQGYGNLKKLWPEASVGMMMDNYHDTEQKEICVSVQSVIRNLDLFKPEYF